MEVLWVSLSCCLFISCLHLSSAECPCSSKDLCNPVVRNPRPEVYGFLHGANLGTYKLFDWTRITTLSVAYNVYSTAADKDLIDLVCYAHARRVKVTIYFDFGNMVLTNITARQLLIISTLTLVHQNYLDGINIDYEQSTTAPEMLTLLTETVQQLTASVKALNSTYQVSFSHTAFIDNGSGRNYDVVALSKIVDFFVLMDYDFGFNLPVQGNKGLCRAGANSDFQTIARGIQDFLKLGIRPDQLVTAFAWYGYAVKCAAVSPSTNMCVFPCGQPMTSLCYSSIMSTLRNSSREGRRFDDVSMSPFFFYQDHLDDSYWRVDYDDMWSLKYKINYAIIEKGLRGVGVFRLDCLANTGDPFSVVDRTQMWQTLPQLHDRR